MNIASQKNSINLYHMGIYANKELLDWFVGEYPTHCKTKLDMGKSCIRFKKMDQIPYDLIGELASKMTSEEWISIYESSIKKQSMKRVIGIGGLFFKTDDPKATKEWYKTHLGFNTDDWGCTF